MAEDPAKHDGHADRDRSRQLHDFSLAGFAQYRARQSGNSTITTTISGGFNSAISLSASGVPSGTTVSFNPQHDSGAGLGQLDHDHHGGGEHAGGNLSHHGDRQWRRHPAEHHRHADRDRSSATSRSRPRRLRSASRKAIREHPPSPPPSVVASTAPSVCRLRECRRARR